MNPRLLKQIIYGAGYLLFFSLIIFGIYYIWFKPAATCFDNKQNQGETGVDCGGPCRPCEIKTLSPVQTSWVKYFPAGDLAGKQVSSGASQTILAAEIKNPNPEWGAAPLSYLFEIYGADGKKIKDLNGKTFIYSGEIKYLVEPVDITFGNIKEVKFSLANPVWFSKTEFPEPLTQVRELKTEPAAEKTLGPTVSGFVSNKNAFPLRKMKVVAFLLNQNGAYVSASKTELENLQAFEERFFKISFPKNVGLVSGPAPSATTYHFTRDLSLGSKGEDVRQLQRFLISQGFFNRETTDYFDPATKLALINYQKKINISPASGILDSKTRSYINALNPPQAPTAPAPNEADPAKTKIYVEALR